MSPAGVRVPNRVVLGSVARRIKAIPIVTQRGFVID